jgi:hypothetical protein
MTQTTSLHEPEPSPQASPAPAIPTLLTLIVAILAPMFLGITAGDIGLARAVALETMNAHRTENRADLLAVAQIIAYGLAALGSLSLSMADDISLSMALRLRNNASALTRSAEKHRAALVRDHCDGWTDDQPAFPMTSATGMVGEKENFSEAAVVAALEATRKLAAETQARMAAAEQLRVQSAPSTPPPAPIATTVTAPVTAPVAAPVAAPAAAPAAAPVTAPISAPMTPPVSAEERRNQMAWANAMINVAGDYTASLPNLPPLQHKTVSLRVAALVTTANDLLAGAPMPALPRLIIPR